MFSFFDKKPNKYDVVEYAVGANQTNNQISLQSGWHLNEKRAYGAVQIVTDQTITIRLNSVSNPAFTMTASQSPLQIDWIAVSDMFITTGASGSAFKVIAAHV